jgi:lipopolysaccharide transport system permease protein
MAAEFSPTIPLQAAPGRQHVRIEPTGTWRMLDIRELWQYRELLYFFVWRDLKVRYNQTVLGAGWAIIQPVMTMVVFTVFFGNLARIPSDGLPYPVFALIALVPWTYFTSALSASSTSLAGYQHIMTKVYFPRLIIPFAAVLAPLVDFDIAFLVLLAVMLADGIPPSGAVLYLPLFMLLAIATAVAAGVWLSALSVRYRDIRHIIPFATQLWLFATPVAYPASLVPPRWRVAYGLNPMVGVIEGFRFVLAGGPSPGALTFVSAAVVTLFLVAGLFHFRKLEGTFADLI